MWWTAAVAAVVAALTFSLTNVYNTSNDSIPSSTANPPFNATLANYRLRGHNGDDNQLTHSFVQSACGANLSVHYTDPSVWGKSTGSKTKPILILTHGYPESSYIWREVTPAVSKRHDRGARTMHRAAVDDNFPGITGMGFFAADIVPYIAEYASFTNPLYAQGYFHWAFLPKGQFATDVIMAYGGGKWVEHILELGSGENEKGLELFKKDQAWEIYINFFNRLSVTNASTFDYQAGAFTDYNQQLSDQTAGIKIKLPTHILYSEYNLGRQFDVLDVWKDYCEPSAGLTVKGVGGKRGHFIIEEAPDEAIKQLGAFMDRLGVAK
ncbi:hypothetical protein PRZ48_009057 [Zasmidium cellare]|uniref:Uncharacterized protein n=1 Tax=Zasmidium cellare TaxID=395010 RepID=A0ABR0EI82_ZASCE|nr:hypothetical protein PRZ48_009057 [Zasmidium cellare]